MLRRSGWFRMLGCVLLLAGCAVPALPAPTASPPMLRTTSIAAGALVTITASGSIAADAPYGCLASLLIEPGSGALDRIAGWDDARFAVDPAGSGARCTVSGPVIGGPPSLGPGRYRLAGVASIVSDVSSPGFSQFPILGSTARCEMDLLVLPATTGIAIHVTFGDGSCTIDVSTS